MDDRLCPLCRKPMRMVKNETVSYDPIVSLEIILFRCPICGHREKAEYLR